MAKSDEDASVRLAALDALRVVAVEGRHLKEAVRHPSWPNVPRTCNKPGQHG